MTLKDAIEQKVLIAEAGKTAISELNTICDRGIEELDELKKEAVALAMKGEIGQLIDLLHHAEYVYDRTNRQIQETADVFLNEIKEFVEENK